MSMSVIPEDADASEVIRQETSYGVKHWRELLRSGAIPSAKLGRTTYVRRSDVRAHIEREFASSAASA